MDVFRSTSILSARVGKEHSFNFGANGTAEEVEKDQRTKKEGSKGFSGRALPSISRSGLNRRGLKLSNSEFSK